MPTVPRNGSPVSPTSTIAAANTTHGRALRSPGSTEQTLWLGDQDDDHDDEPEHLLVAGGDVAPAEGLHDPQQDPAAERAEDRADPGEDDHDEGVQGDLRAHRRAHPERQAVERAG